MAKKEKEKSLFSFKDLLGTIDTSIKGTSIIRETDKSSKKRETISTGIYILNAAMSGSLFGGIPTNRITAIAGETGVGKSFLCYNIVRQAQKDGYNIIYIDSEYSIELDQLPNYGIDVNSDKFSLIRSNVIEDLKIFITKMLDGLKEQKLAGKELPKVMIVLDSVGQLGSRKEVEDALSGNEKADFTKAKALKSFFRIINSDLGYLNIPLLATNQIYKCVTGDTLVLMSDDSEKQIKDIIKGDLVKTLVGNKEVNFIKKYDDAVIFKITLEDGTEVKCTNEHKFLIKREWSEDENDSCWINAEDLKENDTILSIK